MRDYHINVFWSEEGRCYIADIPDLKYCSAHGPTPEAALREVLVAKEAWLETAAYVKHHVRVSGYTGGQLFSDEFVAKTFDYTKGIPRKINLVCVHALMAGFVDRKQIIDEATLRRVINDLEMD